MKKMQYVIKTCSSENVQELQNLLNEMSMNGWDLYTMHEVETDDEFQYNCIFMKEMRDDENLENSDIINISTFKSRMEKMLSPKLSPYELCLDIQGKIKEQKNKIAKIKTELEGETPASLTRKKLNDKISAGLKELEDLKNKLAQATSPDEMYSKLQTEKLGIYLSEELLGYVDQEQNLAEEELVAETVKSRLKLTEELGFVIPKIVFQDDENLNPYEFSIRIRGLDVYKSYVYPNYVMYFAEDIHIDKKFKNVIKDVDYITGKDIVWLKKEQTKDFWEKGFSGCQYIARALEFSSVKYVDDLLDYKELDKYIEIVEKNNPFLVENLMPDYLSNSELRFILTSLIKERVSIKDITYIFEKMNDYAEDSDRSELLKKIRLVLSRQICKSLSDENGVINAIEISQDTLSELTDAEELIDCEDIVRIDADFAGKLADNIVETAKKADLDIIKIVVPLEYRQLLFIILNSYINNVAVLAHDEISYNYSLEIIKEI